MPTNMVRIGIFYDGQYYSIVSNYYNFQHERRARLDIGGLHRFVRSEVARLEGVDSRYTQIVDAHYFRGRLSAAEAQRLDRLYGDRSFDDVLMRQNIVTHYLPLTGSGEEKGVDVWLALEAYEQAMYRKFDVLVLISGDGDYVPLVRKLNALGTRVMVVGWDFCWTDEEARPREQRTAQSLLNEASYSVLLSSVIEDRARQNDPLVQGLFVANRYLAEPPATAFEPVASPRDETPQTGVVQNLLPHYGFVHEASGENLFFHASDIAEGAFEALQRGDPVEYVAGINGRGRCARKVRRLAVAQEPAARPAVAPAIVATPAEVASQPEVEVELALAAAM